MASIRRAEELEAFQRARQLVREIYGITKKREFARDLGLVDQVRRASVSVMANIAEGFERDGKQEFIQFLAQAKGSAGEVRAHLMVALDQQYISDAEFNTLGGMNQQTMKLIGGLMRYLRETDHR